MEYDELLKAIQREGEFPSREAARNSAEIVLAVLGEHLAGGEPKDLAAQLPIALAQALPLNGGAERFGLEEFDLRVAAREGSTPAEAHRHAVAVLTTVLSSVSEGEREHVAAQLPSDFWELLP